MATSTLADQIASIAGAGSGSGRSIAVDLRAEGTGGSGTGWGAQLDRPDPQGSRHDSVCGLVSGRARSLQDDSCQGGSP